MPTVPWHSLAIADVSQRLETTLGGLTSAEAIRRLRTGGPNAIEHRGPPASLMLLLAQFASPLIAILFVAVAIAFIVGEHTDAFVILAIVFFNALVGFWQERRANEAMEKLRSLTPPEVHVLRDGREQLIPTEQVVPGDVVILETGVIVPADGRLIEAVNLKINEAIFSGESVAMEKGIDPIPAATPDADRKNVAWRATTVVYGRGQLLITATGMGTRFGEIVRSVGGSKKSATPFQRHLNSFSRRLTVFILILGALVFGLGLARSLPVTEMFLLSISLVVSLVPEGLPVVITLTLAVGMWQLAKRKALIRKLAAVETLGSVTTIAADKTGTLTFGQMMVEEIVAGPRRLSVSGEGYAAHGDFYLDGKPMDPQSVPEIALALKVGLLCNDARFSLQENGDPLPIGDPTEIALLVAAEKAGFNHQKLDETLPRVGEFPFDFNLRTMTTFHGVADGRQLIAVKGAPRQILDLCAAQLVDGKVVPLTEERKSAVRAEYERMASRALRGLALAYAETRDDWRSLTTQHLKSKLVYLALFGLKDPIRPEARETVEQAQAAGIRVLMLTGDYRVTAESVGQQIGLLRAGDRDALMDGADLAQLDDAAVRQRLPGLRVASRLSPEQKLRIARLLKQNGEVVAMTGDGINDAPALTEADIGVAIGSQATDAAKESAEMVVTDGNLSSIVAAVAAGRTIYRNIQRVLLYLLASNFAELLLILFALAGNLPLPLLPTQVIWLNAVTDPFLGLALAREPAKTTVLQEPPRPRQQPIVGLAQWSRILLVALTIALSSYAAFLIGLARGDSSEQVFALTLTTIALGEWLSAFVFRSSRRSIFRLATSNRALFGALVIVVCLQVLMLSVPRFAAGMHVVALGAGDWLLAIGLSLPVLAVDEIRKLILRRRVAV